MNPLQVVRNQAETFTFNVYDDDGTAKDLSAYTAVLSIYRDIEGTALTAINGVVTDATGGEFTVTIPALTSNALTKTLYPYNINLNDGSLDYMYKKGVLNVTDTKNIWTFDIDYLTGTTLTELRAAVNLELRYNDWSDAKLDGWINDGIQDFCNKTNYAHSIASFDTRPKEYKYELPEQMLRIKRLTYIDANDNEISLIKGKDWYRSGNTLCITKHSVLSTVTIDNSSELEGGQQINVYCSKYASPLSNDEDYLELPYETEDAILDFTVAAAKLEDRLFGEATFYLERYKSKVTRFIDKAAIDELEIFCVDVENPNYTIPGDEDHWILD